MSAREGGVVVTRVLITNRYALCREVIRAVFESNPEYEVVGEAGAGAELAALVQRLQPDVVIVDSSLPGLAGTEVIRTIVQHLPQAKVVMLSDSENEADILGAVQAGASGYVLKSASSESLFSQLKSVIEGGVAMTEDITRKLMSGLSKHQNPAGTKERIAQQNLGQQDVDVLNLVAQGMTNREIADRLFMSEHTVRARVRGLIHRFNLENRTQLAVFSTEATIAREEKAGQPRRGQAAARTGQRQHAPRGIVEEEHE